MTGNDGLLVYFQRKGVGDIYSAPIFVMISMVGLNKFETSGPITLIL